MTLALLVADARHEWVESCSTLDWCIWSTETTCPLSQLFLLPVASPHSTGRRAHPDQFCRGGRLLRFLRASRPTERRVARQTALPALLARAPF